MHTEEEIESGCYGRETQDVTLRNPLGGVYK